MRFVSAYKTYRTNKIFNIRIVSFPKPKINECTNKDTKTYSNYMSFFLGSCLAVSEILPFTTDSFHGITHSIKMLYSINKEYKNNF